MPLASTFDRDSLSHRVVEHIIGHIRENRLESGRKLPSEVQVSNGLGVSRGIVREAYSLLRASGVIDVANGRAPRVGHLKSDAFAQLMSHALLTRQVTPDDMLDLRSSIEVRAAELAAEKRSDGDVETLRGILVTMKDTYRDPDEFVQHDVRFHEAVGKATGNPLFELLGGALRQCLEDSIRAGIRSRVTHKQLAGLLDTHTAIVDAIEAKTSARAGHLMALHFKEAKGALRGVFLPRSPA